MSQSPGKKKTYKRKTILVTCGRCGVEIENRRRKQHWKNKKCKIVAEQAAADAGVDLEIICATADETQSAHASHKHRNDLLGSREARVQVREDIGSRDIFRLSEARMPEGLKDFLFIRAGMKEATSTYCWTWLRRFLIFENGLGVNWEEGDNLVRRLADQQLLDRFWKHMRDKYDHGIANLLKIHKALVLAISFVTVTKPEVAEQYRAILDAQRTNLDLLPKVIRHDKKAIENGGTSGRSVEDLMENNEWAEMSDLKLLLEKGTEKFLNTVKTIQECDRVLPTDAISCAAFIAYAIVVAGTPVRAGTIEALSLDDAVTLAEEGVVTTKTFKTAKTHGVVAIRSPPWLCKVIYKYVAHVRIRLVNGDDPTNSNGKFLINSLGRPLQSLGRNVTQFTHKMIGKMLNITRIRQIIETASVKGLGDADQAHISKAMTHSSSVANAYYQKIGAEEAAENAQAAVNQLMGGGIDTDLDI